MTRLSGPVACCLVASLVQGCAMQAEQRAVAQKDAQREIPGSSPPPEISIARVQQLQQAYSQWKGASYSKSVNCDPDNHGVCQNLVTIFMFQWTSGGRTYCSGIVPEEVKFSRATQGNPKRIIWELKLLNENDELIPKNSTFSFHKDQGILLLGNFGQGSNKPQLKEGKIGGGPGFGANDKFHMKNEHTEPGSAAYLPIILHTIPATSSTPEMVGLCGTPDPRIVNE